MLRIIALTDAQKNIAIQQTGMARRPSVMILIKTLAGECFIRQKRYLVRKLGKLLQRAIQLITRERPRSTARMNRLFQLRRGIAFGR